MPVLHRYVSGDGHYAKAWINGSIVTVQVSPEGRERLEKESIADGDKFPLSVLIDLLADGHAFTGGGDAAKKADFHEAEQFVFGFDENTDAEKDLPVCEESGQFGDLHLVTHGGGEHTQLLSPEVVALCKDVSLSLPLDLLSNAALHRLLASGRIQKEAACVAVLRDFFGRSRSDAWVVHQADVAQQFPLDLGEGDGLALA